MITRRTFLKGILAAGAAPAICKAENLMKIQVPKRQLILPEWVENAKNKWEIPEYQKPMLIAFDKSQKPREHVWVVSRVHKDGTRKVIAQGNGDIDAVTLRKMMTDNVIVSQENIPNVSIKPAVNSFAVKRDSRGLIHGISNVLLQDV